MQIARCWRQRQCAQRAGDGHAGGQERAIRVGQAADLAPLWLALLVPAGDRDQRPLRRAPARPAAGKRAQAGACRVLVAAAGTAQRRRPGRPPAAALLEPLRWRSLGRPSRWRWLAVGLSTSGVFAWAQSAVLAVAGGKFAVTTNEIEGQIQFSSFAFAPPVCVSIFHTLRGPPHSRRHVVNLAPTITPAPLPGTSHTGGSQIH